MLRAALIGVGSMGRGHLDNYIRFMREGKPIQLVALCDINPEKFKNFKSNFNIKGIGDGTYNFEEFHCYTDMDEMLEKEDLDMVSVVLPTYLHCEVSVKCLKKGLHVFCEKPMALSNEQCQLMVDTANAMGKKLMIGQCLRFWGEYEVLKKYVEEERFGKVAAGYFFRGGSLPQGSYQNWYLKKELGGGALLDQHIHDVDMIQLLFGLPEAVCALGKTIVPGSGFDTVSTNYLYADGKAINAQDDWALRNGGFSMVFRVNFEKGTMFLDHNGFHIYDVDGKEIIEECDHENAYYKEILYFTDCIANNKPNLINPPEASRDTIRVAMAEVESAEKKGQFVPVL